MPCRQRREIAHRDLRVPAGKNSENDRIRFGQGNPRRNGAQGDQADPCPGHYAFHGYRDDTVTNYGIVLLPARMPENFEKWARVRHQSSSAS
jgi:hypothetical protein